MPSYTSPSISFLTPALRPLGGSSQKSALHTTSHLKRLRFGLALSGTLRIAAHQRGSVPSKGLPQTKHLSLFIFILQPFCRSGRRTFRGSADTSPNQGTYLRRHHTLHNHRVDRSYDYHRTKTSAIASTLPAPSASNVSCSLC